MKDLEFRARLVDPQAAQEQLDGGARVGEADVAVALFGIQDTGKPVGVAERQVIDSGAFGSWIRDNDFGVRPVPYLLDHGHAHFNGGFVDDRLRIGKADQFREEDPELLFRGLINLGKQIGREAFSDMVFDPANTPHSFRWGDDKTYRSTDGVQHVSWIDGCKEVSKVGMGAQMGTGVKEGTITARTEAQLREWIDDNPEAARNLLGFLRQNVEYTPDGTQPSVGFRATSLMRLAEQVRTAWYAEERPEGFVDDVLVDDGTMRSGTLVCATTDGSFVEYTWNRSDAGVTFGEQGRAVEAAWVSARAAIVKMLAFADEASIAEVLKTDPAVRGIVEAALSRADQLDAVTAWYEATMFRPSLTPV